jgi:hypothetical protein
VLEDKKREQITEDEDKQGCPDNGKRNDALFPLWDFFHPAILNKKIGVLSRFN